MRTTTNQLDPYSPEGCFIATAAYGTETHHKIDILREFRDKYLKTNAPGRKFVKFYYSYGPKAAQYISKRPLARKMVRIGLVEPLVKVSKPLTR